MTAILIRQLVNSQPIIPVICYETLDFCLGKVSFRVAYCSVDCDSVIGQLVGIHRPFARLRIQATLVLE